MNKTPEPSRGSTLIMGETEPSVQGKETGRDLRRDTRD